MFIKTMGKLVISLQRINNRENLPLLLKFNNFPSKAKIISFHTGIVSNFDLWSAEHKRRTSFFLYDHINVCCNSSMLLPLNTT